MKNRSRAFGIVASSIILSAAAATLSAQEITWVETKFHRVHLNNGNFIDGRVLQVTDTDVLLRLPAGDMSIRKYTIDRIELMKMRSLMEKPKLDPPLRSVPSPIAVPVETALKAPVEFAPAPAPPELIGNVKAILARLKVATASQKDDLVDQLVKQPQAGAYLASLLPTLAEEPAYMVRSALVRMKDPGSVPYLIRALDSEKAYVQIDALGLLGLLGDVEAALKIRPFVASGPAAVRATAIEALQQIQDVEALEAIAGLIADPDDMIRIAAISASLEIGRSKNRMDTVASYFRQLLPGSQGRVAKELLSATGRGKMVELWPAVASFLKDVDPVLRRSSAVALQLLSARESAGDVAIQLALEQDPKTLVELARTAGALKSLDAVPPLIHLLRSSDENVVRSAASALELLTNQKFGTSQDRWTEWWDRNSQR